MKNFHQNCPLFRNLENEDSALAALCARNKNYEKGEFLLHAGEPTREFGILTRGTAHIVREDEEGNPVLVAELGSGELFAEAFALVGTPLAVSVIAASDCEALWLSAQKFADADANLQPVAANLLQILAQKSVALTERVECLSRRTLRGKVLCYLKKESERIGSDSFTIPFDRQALADFLGTDRSALSAMLSKLQREGALEFHKNRFRLKNI